MPRISKKFALLLVLAMLATMFVGMGSASAATTNVALTVPTVNISSASTPAAPRSLGTIQITETTIGSIVYGTQIVVSLPAGSNYNLAPTEATKGDYFNCPDFVGQLGTPNGLTDAEITVGATSTNRVLILNVINRANMANPAVINLTFNSIVNGGDSRVWITSGATDYKVNILDTSKAVTSGDVINAHVGVGGTTAFAMDTPAVTQGSGRVLGPLRIVENQTGALIAGSATTNTITLTMPEGITFTNLTAVYAGGWAPLSWSQSAPGVNSSGLSKVTCWVNTVSTGNPGVIDLNMTVDIDTTAKKGDIACSIGGTNPFITPGSVVVGRYGEFGVTGTCDNPTNIYAGRCDAKIGTLVMTENIPATLVATRTVNLELPEGCRWVSIPVAVTTKSSALLGAGAYMNGTNYRVISYTVNNASAAVASDIEFRQGSVSVPADFTPGDLNVTFTGTAGALADDGTKVSTKVATIVAPITLTGTTPSPTVIIGAQAQNGESFDVVEAGVGAIAARIRSTGCNLVVACPAGVRFAELPDISVTGDLKLDLTNAKLTADDRSITIPVTTSSVTTASTINFSNVKFTLDRTVPEGPMKLQASGSAVDWWPVWYLGWTPSLIFDYTTAAEGQVANVTTPAPDQQDKTATFVIGQSSFTLEGVDITMDVAPYIKDGRTFLPIAYVAQALGIDASNVIWDPTAQKVTLMKGDKVLQLTIGSPIMLVNGAAITLDAAPEISNSRTCLPVALVAKAFGQSIAWDAATQTVTINP